MSSASTYKILIIGPAWIDMIMAQSQFKALCQQHDARDQRDGAAFYSLACAYARSV